MGSKLENCINFSNNDETEINGYELSKLLIRNGRKLDLKTSELLVFIALSSYYNGKPVFPKIKTLSDNTNLSDKAVRTALNTLIKMGYLIKAKRGNHTNSNIYNINIKAVINTVKSGKFFHAKPVNFTASCIEQTMEIKQQQKEKKEKKDVVVSSYKHRTIKIDEVPDIIKMNKKVLNPCAYWASLSQEARNEYLQKQALANAAAEKKAEAKRQADLELMKQRKEAEEAKKQARKSIEEIFSREDAICHIIRLPESFVQRSKLSKNLMKIYNITDEELRERKETQTKETTQTILENSTNV